MEARDVIGGTWDLFRYPGVRSDSDMHTLGYRFQPWTQAKAIADGPSILDYGQLERSELRDIRFSTTRLRPGYVMPNVDTFLEEVTQATW